jgi:UDP-N-acetylglucosamine 2-epimerase (non-hydrolysing)
MHPRTIKKIEEYDLLKRINKIKNIFLTKPLGYLDFIKLISISELIMTDSGGIQEEAAILNKPCITLRYNTERPETVECGLNYLVGRDIIALKNIFELNRINITKANKFNKLYGDGKSGKRIVEILKKELVKGIKIKSPHYMKSGSMSQRLLKIDKKISGNSLINISKNVGGIIRIIYDENGLPHFPYLNTTLKPGWTLIIQGDF